VGEEDRKADKRQQEAREKKTSVANTNQGKRGAIVEKWPSTTRKASQPSGGGRKKGDCEKNDNTLSAKKLGVGTGIRPSRLKGGGVSKIT